MSGSKQAYFSFMIELDQKSVDVTENLKLEQLLQAHDERVSAFNSAMQATRSIDEASRNRLIAAMGGSMPEKKS